MSFGLSKFLKNILPKRLFYRGLLIVAVPIVILQIAISLVFFDSLWIKTNKGLTRALVSEIVTIIDIYDFHCVFKKFCCYSPFFKECFVPSILNKIFFLSSC